MIVVWVLLAAGLVGLVVLGLVLGGHVRRLARQRAAVRRDLLARTAALRALVNERPRRGGRPAAP